MWECMEKLIVISGQTSSGKSDLAIELAKRFNGEIVSADSRQVYRGLDFCSGKVSKEEQAEAIHHLLSITEIGSNFTLFDYQRLAYEKIDEILKSKKVPILVGGTGLYVRAVTDGYNLTEISPNKEKREELNKLNVQELLDLCEKLGIETNGEVNSRRLIRLIEMNGKKQNQNTPKYECLKLAIRFDREKIYERIKVRLEKRMPNMIEEIKNLISSGVDKQSLKNLGLEAKCVTEFLDGEYDSYDAFFEELYKQERHYAKRQQTWLNKEANLIWLDGENNLLEEATKLVSDFLG